LTLFVESLISHVCIAFLTQMNILLFKTDYLKEFYLPSSKRTAR